MSDLVSTKSLLEKTAESFMNFLHVIAMILVSCIYKPIFLDIQVQTFDLYSHFGNAARAYANYAISRQIRVPPPPTPPAELTHE